MPIPKMQIQNVSFDSDGDMHITYVMARDVKVNGVGIANTMLVPAGDNYDEEIRAVREAIEYAVGDVLEDMPTLQTLEDAIAEDDAHQAAQKAAQA